MPPSILYSPATHALLRHGGALLYHAPLVHTSLNSSAATRWTHSLNDDFVRGNTLVPTADHDFARTDWLDSIADYHYGGVAYVARWGTALGRPPLHFVHAQDEASTYEGDTLRSAFRRTSIDILVSGAFSITSDNTERLLTLCDTLHDGFIPLATLAVETFQGIDAFRTEHNEEDELGNVPPSALVGAPAYCGIMPGNAEITAATVEAALASPAIETALAASHIVSDTFDAGWYLTTGDQGNFGYAHYGPDGNPTRLYTRRSGVIRIPFNVPASAVRAFLASNPPSGTGTGAADRATPSIRLVLAFAPHWRVWPDYATVRSTDGLRQRSLFYTAVPTWTPPDWTAPP